MFGTPHRRPADTRNLPTGRDRSRTLAGKIADRRPDVDLNLRMPRRLPPLPVAVETAVLRVVEVALHTCAPGSEGLRLNLRVARGTVRVQVAATALHTHPRILSAPYTGDAFAELALWTWAFGGRFGVTHDRRQRFRIRSEIRIRPDDHPGGDRPKRYRRRRSTNTPETVPGPVPPRCQEHPP
ncbi:MAG TPA: hypothetical protein VFZ68_01775, partial [Acidimicrobiales bacterium]